MSKIKLEFVLTMIDDIEYTVEVYNSVTIALADRIAKPAIMMALLQIGETLGKMTFDNETLREYAKGAYNVRNFLAHDYEGINIVIIENIVRTLLEPLKNEILSELAKVDTV